jgi:hypothetical protein
MGTERERARSQTEKGGTHLARWGATLVRGGVDWKPKPRKEMMVLHVCRKFERLN